MRICLVLEGCYPYVFGGVSTWMHQYINQMQEHEFVLWVIGANAEKRGKFVYELPENVVEVHEVFLDDALQVPAARPVRGWPPRRSRPPGLACFHGTPLRS